MSNEVEQHLEMMRELKKDPTDILHERLGKPWAADLAHMSMGLAGETGELIDYLKKGVMNARDMEAEKVLDESGDVLFYLVGILDSFGYTIDQALAYNIGKLRKRYPEGYSNTNSQMRLDELDS